MKEKLKILHLEDNLLDYELIQSIIKQEYPDCEVINVYEKKEFLENLKKNQFDFILADYDLPNFDGLKAFKISKEINPSIPFIFVTGKISEDAAIEAIKEGADDYVFKNKLNKLIPIIKKVLKNKKNIFKCKDIEFKFSKLVENSIDGIALTDEEGRIIEWNNAMEKITLLKKEEVEKKFIWDVQFELSAYNKKDIKFFENNKNRIINILKNGNSNFLNKVVEDIILTKDKNLKWVENILSPIKTPWGYIITCFTRDISEKKELNLKLINQINELKDRAKELDIFYAISNIVSQSELSLYDIFLKTAKILPNAFKYPEITCVKIRYNKKEFKNKNFKSTKWKIKNDIYINEVVIGRIEIFYLEKRPDADKGPFYFEEIRMLESISERLGIIVENKLIQEALKISEKKYRTIIENTKDIIYSCSLEGVIDFISPHVDWFGYSEGDILGKNIFDFIYHEDIDHVKKNITEALNSNRGITSIFRLKGKDGSLNWIEELGGPVELGKEIKLLGTLRDINERMKADTDLKKAKHEAENANKAKTDFIAKISHEIRTPMNGIIGMDSLLLETSLSEEQKEYAEIIKRSAESLLGLLNNLLDISKIEKGTINQENIEFDLRELIKDSIKLFKYNIAKKNIKIIEYINSGIPKNLFGDANKIKQVIINLLSNSIKYTQSGSIKVAANIINEKNNEIYLKIKVTDSGIGIKDDDKKKLFKAYSQIDSSSTRTHRGAGLGLLISKQLIEAIGGEIGFESRINKGSTFWFKINLKKIKRKISVKDTNITFDINKNKDIKILLADDDETNQLIILKFLEKSGYQCDIAYNGIEVLELLKKNKYSLILMDIQMPEMDGYETSIKIRNSNDAHNIPIIALTASALKSEEKKCFEAGMNDYLSKPIEKNKLLNAIKKWTKTRI